jgi:hypothetical protein
MATAQCWGVSAGLWGRNSNHRAPIITRSPLQGAGCCGAGVMWAIPQLGPVQRHLYCSHRGGTPRLEHHPGAHTLGAGGTWMTGEAGEGAGRRGGGGGAISVSVDHDSSRCCVYSVVKQVPESPLGIQALYLLMLMAPSN